MVFTQILCWLTVITGSCYFFPGCVAYHTMRIETLEPAQVMLESEGRLAFLNRNLLYRADSTAHISVRNAYSFDDVPTAFSDGLNGGLAFAEPIDSVIVVKNTDRTYCKDSLPSAILPEIVEKICSKFGIAYLISLECHFYQQMDKKAYHKWYVRLYDSQGVIIDSALIKNEMKSSKNTFVLQDEILMKSWDNGKEYAERITPHWAETERRIYRTGDILRLGYLYFRLGQTDEAIKAWSVAQHFSTGEAIRASINLAYLYENGEDMENAVRVLREAVQMTKENDVTGKDVTYLEKYLKIIEKRIENTDVLNYQIKKSINNE